ncbi:hypothetical protein LP422_22510 [Janibacter limosus]|uniref:hypothetical protein n=1 Tax=Janibacter limosus TaxID=53458 RepID=UPI0035E2A69C|nr:hypothetical protein LP422_22510 [Janibacter limosus]
MASGPSAAPSSAPPVIGQIETLGVSLLPDHASFLVFGAMGPVLLLRPRGLLGKKEATA